MAIHNTIGRLGEDLAADWLRRKGFTIVSCNYRQKWGEIDIIAKMDGRTHFCEVKTVSYETMSLLEYAVSHGTWRPEEKVDSYKLKKFARTVETWLSENKYLGSWQIDVIAVRMVPREKHARITIIENVIIE